ncbi:MULTISPECIES: hypothetical protein [Protofrankia]|uniref:Uncharacterized protein n=1 Tax=Protofrankia coriariae TaxID=1562887 RepID=A0ABR5F6E2_9ACTN|nr:MULTISPECIES: hypothetical protein [Protofrankia]KLL12299.1 hypothetical protein FrCorBMG51_06380 [Protofrankia coriariae]ONH37756.1 hypothetical protein BL254_02430 [Protofrankia sp. BMG5.30]
MPTDRPGASARLDASGQSWPPGAVAVERLAAAVRPGGDAVFVLYGLGMDDVPVGRDYQERDTEEAPWETPRAGGFERIAFCSARDSLYFRDVDPADQARHICPGHIRPIHENPASTKTPAVPTTAGPTPAGPATAGPATGSDQRGGTRYFSGPLFLGEWARGGMGRHPRGSGARATGA